MSDGLLVVDKPQGWTSHDVVARVRRLAGTRRVGHAGTLDPMATGVLVLGINRGTKLLTYLVGADKDYTATIRLGQRSHTDDADGEIESVADAHDLPDDQVLAAVTSLTGRIEQVPSAVSAIKVNGRRAYARVREGEQVALTARPVTVSSWTVTARRSAPTDAPTAVDLDVAVTVSSGTYVRALARDLGARLGVGGHLTALRRTRVGAFSIDDAVPLGALQDRVEGGSPLPVLPLADAARTAYPVRELTAEQARALSFGQRIAAAQPGRPEPVAALSPTGELVAMLDEREPTARSLVVFAPATS